MIGIITYISVLERTKEIGILRSIGASKRDISRVFNAETLIVGFAAGMIGIIFTVLVCLPINAILHAVTRMATGKQLDLMSDGFHNTVNPHVRFEALRCMYNYGEEGRALFHKTEAEATESEKKYFAFFHNPITLEKIRLDKEQAYHPSIETVYNLSY